MRRLKRILLVKRILKRSRSFAVSDRVAKTLFQLQLSRVLRQIGKPIWTLLGVGVAGW